MTKSLPLPGDVLEVTMTGMAHGGDAVGRADDGRAVFVAGGLPDERVRVRLTEVRARFAKGTLAEVIGPASARRTAPPCPYHGTWPDRAAPGKCGACQWQHIAYAGQLQYKRAILGDALGRIGGISAPPVAETLGMEEPWGYRNHVRMVARDGRLGFRSSAGHDVVPVDRCPVAHPLVEDLIHVCQGLPDDVEVSLRAGINTEDRMVVLHASPEELGSIEADTDASVAVVDRAGDATTVAGEAFLTEAVRDRVFLIPPDGFFQVNTQMCGHLVDLVRDAVGGTVRRLVDVHSGVGLFAVLLADLAEEVFAVERHGPSVAAAVENAAGLDHVTLVEAPAAEGMAYLDFPVDVVVLDPPRDGIDDATMRLLAQREPPTIVYVSCEPATLARDARQLVAAGWTLESSRPVDMFPHTHHVESVNAFRR